MKTNKIMLVIGGLVMSVAAYSATSYLNAANSIAMKVTGMYLGSYSGGICGGWKTVFENTSATAQDFTQTLDLGEGNVDLGNYDCVALRVDNSLNVAVNGAAGGACVGWTGQTIYENSYGTAYDLNGQVMSGIGGDRNASMYLYFRVGGAGDVYNPHDGAALNQAISVTEGTSTLTFKFQASAGHSIKDLQDDGVNCTFDDGNVGFAVEQ